jgi:hypothetical protein
MTNTVQMHKFLAPRQRFKPFTIKHQHYVQRTYVPLGMGRDRDGQQHTYRPGQRNGTTASAGTANTGAASEDH